MKALATISSLWIMTACAPLLTEAEVDMPLEEEKSVITTQSGTGMFETMVAAIKDDAWVHFSFDTGQEVVLFDSFASNDWDLRFSRFNIRVNGGVSGPGDVEAGIMAKVPYDNVREVPAIEYKADGPDQDGDGDEDLVFREANESSTNGWFEYEPRFHTVSPADVSYIVKATNGTVYKMEVTAYYDENGEGGFPKFRWAPIGVR
jgi:hypothetical protein